MKLQLRRSGGNRILTDERGVPLPNQRSLAVLSKAGKAVSITVTFTIDGDRVKLTGLPAVNPAVFLPGVFSAGVMD